MNLVIRNYYYFTIMDYTKIIEENLKCATNPLEEQTTVNTVLFHPKIVNLITGNPLFVKMNDYDIRKSIEDYRKITLSRFRAIINRKVIDINKIVEDPTDFIRVMNTLHAYDCSLAIKFGVNFGLFGSNLVRLCSAEQSNIYVPKINSGAILGCLAITEILHGSNVKALQTIVTIDKTKNALIFNTPKIGAAKCWIGNANDCTHAIVFAMLCVNEEKILLPFVIRVRKDLKLCDGISIGEMGSKKGLNGVDNGWIIFKNYHAKYNSLLDSFGKINKSGDYCYDGDRKELYSKALSALSGGRGILSYGSTIVSLKAVALTINYANIRKQFTENMDVPSPSNKEINLIKYSTHYVPLMVMLAKSIVYIEVLDTLKKISLEEFTTSGNVVTKNIHIVTSGMKIICSEHAEAVCNSCRLFCGGHGYSSYNEISSMHNDIDIYRTFEGDNCVLRQQICFDILKKFNKKSNKDNQNFKQKIQTETPNLNQLLKQYRIALCNNIVKELYENYLTLGKFEAWNKVLHEVILLTDTFMCEKIVKIFSMTGSKLLDQQTVDIIQELFTIDFILKNFIHFARFEILSGKDIEVMKNKYDNNCKDLVVVSPDIIKIIGLPKFSFKIPLLEKHLLTSKL